ncbi:hypothetical protein JTB14_028522 [Gonioctena quinquepunctata]|nr:hypothetical protein JTB14_028522 [Gonioctena quinquepunctata]
MNAALEAVARGIPVVTAAKIPSVPRVILMYKSSGRLPTECRMGSSTVLTTNEEDLLEKWILPLAKVHHPVNKEQLLDSTLLQIGPHEQKRILFFRCVWSCFSLLVNISDESKNLINFPGLAFSLNDVWMDVTH